MSNVLKIGDPMHYWSEEVGIINGTYMGRESAIAKSLKLHEFADLAGTLCLGQIRDMEYGHHKKGKKKWGAKK